VLKALKCLENLETDTLALYTYLLFWNKEIVL